VWPIRAPVFCAIGWRSKHDAVVLERAERIPDRRLPVGPGQPAVAEAASGMSTHRSPRRACVHACGVMTGTTRQPRDAGPVTRCHSQVGGAPLRPLTEMARSRTVRRKRPPCRRCGQSHEPQPTVRPESCLVLRASEKRKPRGRKRRREEASGCWSRVSLPRIAPPATRIDPSPVPANRTQQRAEEDLRCWYRSIDPGCGRRDNRPVRVASRSSPSHSPPSPRRRAAALSDPARSERRR